MKLELEPRNTEHSPIVRLVYTDGMRYDDKSKTNFMTNCGLATRWEKWSNSHCPKFGKVCLLREYQKILSGFYNDGQWENIWKHK